VESPATQGGNQLSVPAKVVTFFLQGPQLKATSEGFFFFSADKKPLNLMPVVRLLAYFMLLVAMFLNYKPKDD
jgi:hypothetical protein